MASGGVQSAGDGTMRLIGIAALTATASSLLTYAVFRWQHTTNIQHCEEDGASTPYRAPARDENDATDNVSEHPRKRQDPYDPSPRKGYLSWDDYFMAVAFLSAQRSKDPNKQVGACIVDQQQVICGIGYNGFPRGCSDSQLPWSKKSQGGDPLNTKYPYVCHAEMNAILNKNGASVVGAKMYVTMFPCNECAKLLIQAGIKEIIYHEDKSQPRAETPAPGAFKLDQQYAASKRLLALAGVTVRQHLFKRPVSLHLTNHPVLPVRELAVDNGTSGVESIQYDNVDKINDQEDEISPALAALLGGEGSAPPLKALDFNST